MPGGHGLRRPGGKRPTPNREEMDYGMDTDTQLATVTERPQVRVLIDDFKRCSPWGDGGWNRVTDNENIRFTRWAGQSGDGKKHDQASKPAFPFDGASDTRIPLADAIINENVAVCAATFWRAMIRPKSGITEESEYAVKLADYYVNTVLYHDLVREVELSEQYRSMLGWVVLHPTWVREVAMGHREVKLQDLVAMGQQVPPSSPLALLPQMLMDPTLDDQTGQIIQTLYTAFAAQQVAAITELTVPPLRPAKVRQVIKELRDTGVTEIPLPYVAKNQPEIVALKPWDEFFVSNACTDIQKSPRNYRRVWMSEVEMRSKILTSGWDKKWVTEALKSKGKYSTWNASSSTGVTPPMNLADAMASNTPTSWVATNQNEDMVEVIYACHRQLDQDNVPGVYYTVFSAFVCDDPDKAGRELFAESGLMDYTRGQFPYVSGQRENWSRCLTASRGVPQVAGAWQREIKVQRDGLVDHTSLGVTPPLLLPKGAMGTKFKFAPAAQNEVTVGREPHFMEVPHGGTPLALELVTVVNADVDNYFGRMSMEVPPARVQVKQTMLTQPFLLMWSKALQQMLALAQCYLPDDEFSRITGAPEGWLEQRRHAHGALDVDLHFDVRELDPEFVLQQLQTINSAVLPGDVAGVIDRAKFTKLQLRAINPALSKELVSDQGEASQRMFKDVQTDIAMMFLGNEPQYVQMDPSAQGKLQFASQIVAANPNYQQAMQQGGRFADLMKKYAMNLQFSITQEQNKKVGAIGVKPEAMAQQ